MVIPPALFFVFWIALSIITFLWSHINFKIAFCVFVKTDLGIFIRVALNLQIAFGKMGKVTILNFWIHENGRSFHFWCLILFISSVSYILTVEDFHFLGKIYSQVFFFILYLLWTLFFSTLFPISVQNGYWFLWANFISCCYDTPVIQPSNFLVLPGVYWAACGFSTVPAALLPMCSPFVATLEVFCPFPFLHVCSCILPLSSNWLCVCID